jgi:hypothetical protein
MTMTQFLYRGYSVTLLIVERGDCSVAHNYRIENSTGETIYSVHKAEDTKAKAKANAKLTIDNLIKIVSRF